MKTIISFLIIGFLLNPNLYSQSVSGKVSISGLSKDGIVKEQTPVELLKRFKDNTYKIGFTYSWGTYPPQTPQNETSGTGKTFIGWGSYPPQIPLLFDMKTIVKKNGKVISTSSRLGWPWLEGDMHLPVEAFDFIPMLQKEITTRKNSGQDIKGSVSPASLFFNF